MAGALVTVQIPAFMADAKKVAGLERDILILVGHVVLLASYPQGVLARKNQSSSSSSEQELSSNY